MVTQKYRWDFIGLSTDTKPTPQTSDRVVNGSTFYCSDTSKLYVFCDSTWYERKPLGGGGGGGDYTAGNGINITDDTISVDTTVIQPKLTAGANVNISDNIISATDTTYSAFTGTDGTAAGAAGLVPAPATTDAGKFLGASGLWETVQAGGSGITELTSANYNWPAASPDGVAMWKLSTGIYSVATGTKIYVTSSSSSTSAYRGFFLLHSNGYQCSYLMIKAANDSMEYWDMNIEANTVREKFYISQPVDRLNSSSADSPLSANQGRVLKDLVDGLAISGAGAPTTSTVGTVGKLYEDTTNGKLYICTDTTGGTYTWGEVGAGGSGPTVVQSIGTSTTDVMSQNAVTGMVFRDPSSGTQVQIGASANTERASGVAIGHNAQVRGEGYHGVAIGHDAEAGGTGSIALGAGAQTYQNGTMNIGTVSTSWGYNNSAYRLLTGLYDGQSDHDAATVGQIKMGVLSTTPTGTTAGFPGRLYTYDSGGGTYEVYLCVHDNGDNTYVWKQVSLI